MLAAHDVDEKAQHALFLLAQHSPDGARRANQAVSRLFKLQGDGTYIRSASAIVQGSITEAWVEMRADGYA